MASDELLKFLVEGNYVGEKFAIISFLSRFLDTELSFFTIGMGSGLDRPTVKRLLEELVGECVLFQIDTGAITMYTVSPKYRPLLEGMSKLHPAEKQKLEKMVGECNHANCGDSTWG